MPLQKAETKQSSGVVKSYFTLRGSPRSLPLLFLVSESFPVIPSEERSNPGGAEERGCPGWSPGLLWNHD